MQPTSELERLGARALGSSEDREPWHAARALGVTGSDIRRLRTATPLGRRSMILKKLAGGDSAREINVRELVWGRVREAEISRLVWDRFRIQPNLSLFRAAENPRHLATPDGVGVEADFDAAVSRIVVSEVKTGKFDVSPASEHFARYGYYDQMQWEMYVTGAWRCRFTWEVHDDDWSDWPTLGPTPLLDEPEGTWVLRDDDRIAELVALADDFLASLDAERDRDPAERDYLSEALLAALLEAREGADLAEEALRSHLDETHLEVLTTPYGNLSYGLAKGAVRFNSAAFRKDHPGLYEEYKQATTPRKKTLRVSVPGARKSEREEE